jgi:hypothetical protein
MTLFRRIVVVGAGVVAFLAYVWVAGVTNAGRVKRRKRLRRAARRT